MTESEILLSIRMGGNKPLIQPCRDRQGYYEILLIPNSPADIWRVWDKKLSLKNAIAWMDKYGIDDYECRKG